ncbi:MAG TPA: alpha/beta hydrolase [Anaeromyxobacteraceae bacterium]|nr:alpha/beta hydrolase [Anaeromyxobacteraceae bacterium]
MLIETSRGKLEHVTVGEGPCVLALHGAMGGHDQSLLLARTIGDAGYRYLAVSRPGYLGTALRSGRSPAEQADLYAAALDALGVRSVAVMAVSGGGPSALEFALRHRERCWALVLVSTCSGGVATKIPMSFQLTKRLLRWRWFADAMRRRAEHDPRRAAGRSIADPVARELFAELLASTFDRPHLRLRGTENDIAVARSTEYALERVEVPALVVHGTEDPLVPFELHGRRLAERIPGAELLAIPGGEHACIFTHRDEVRARVGSFLRTHAPNAHRALA